MVPDASGTGTRLPPSRDNIDTSRLFNPWPMFARMRKGCWDVTEPDPMIPGSTALKRTRRSWKKPKVVNEAREPATRPEAH